MSLTAAPPPRGFLLEHVWLLGGSLAYFATAKLGMALFSLQPGNITLLWLPSGIGFVMYLRFGMKALPFIFLASFLANYPGMSLESLPRHILHTLIAAGADSLAAWFASAMMLRCLPNGLAKPYDLVTFCLFVCLLPILVSSTILSTNLALGAYIPWSSTGSVIGMLLIGDSLGILVVFPLVDAWRQHAGTPAKEWGLWMIMTFTVLGMVHLAFTQLSGLIFLVAPMLLYYVFHGRTYGVYLTLALVVCMVVSRASLNLGPFQVPGAEQAHFMLVSYLFSTVLAVMGIVLQHHEIVREKKSSKDWQHRANHDPLTGIKNRQMFAPALENEIERARRTKRPFSVGLFDLDHFKRINDTYGHLVGDQVLACTAIHFQKLLRGIDTVARIGGEEFAILFPETPLIDSAQAMERIRSIIERSPIIAGEHSITVTVSGGLAEFNPDDPTISAEAILNCADQRLYQAKREGRNRIISRCHTECSRKTTSQENVE